MNHVPHEFEVDPEVPVDQPITHAGHAAPVHVGVGRAELRRQPLRRRADHLEAADEGPLKRSPTAASIV